MQNFNNRSIARREFLATAGNGLALAVAANSAGPAPAAEFAPVSVPAWVHGITRMAFLTPGQVDAAAAAGVQVVHGNAVWPYFPLKKDGGGLSAADDKILRSFVDGCHGHGMKLVLGLPPFPPVALVKKHPDWRVHPDRSSAVLKLTPEEGNLGTRLGCNLGPWGKYLIDVCVELVRGYHVDGFSFDGNYHPPICYCPACANAYRNDRKHDLPAGANLDDVAYREYLVWRGEQLEKHYRRMQVQLKQTNPDAVLISWTVNAGRFGHFLHSPRAMPTRLNLLFDLPMQEWWLDETNYGASVAPAFGAAYLRAVAGGHPCAGEAYLMSRGNPYGSDSFPIHERLTRTALALTNGSITAESFGWPGHGDSTAAVFRQTRDREKWLTQATPLAWAGMLVSEQTRQFYAYKDILDRFLSHHFGAFRCAVEEHLPLTLLNDWEILANELKRFAVIVLPNAAALSDTQVAAIREYVQHGGGLVATVETSLFDELGRPRRDFALADVFGVSYVGRPKAPLQRPTLDANFAITVDEHYWRQRTGVAKLAWKDHPLVHDTRLHRLVPQRSATFRGPQVLVSTPREADTVAATMTPEGTAPVPGLVARTFGKGRVVYCAAGIDAALWSYAYPYQRRILARAIAWTAREPKPITVKAPMCVQTAFYRQEANGGRRSIIHFFNGVNTTANHGLPAMDVPLREEVIPISGIQVRFAGKAPSMFHLEPSGRKLTATLGGGLLCVDLPPLEIHAMLVAED